MQRTTTSAPLIRPVTPYSCTGLHPLEFVPCCERSRYHILVFLSLSPPFKFGPVAPVRGPTFSSFFAGLYPIEFAPCFIRFSSYILFVLLMISSIGFRFRLKLFSASNRPVQCFSVLHKTSPALSEASPNARIFQDTD